MKKSTLKQDVLYSVLGILFMLFCWCVLFFVIKNDYLMPSPFKVFYLAVSLIFDLSFYSYFFTTLLRVLIAVLIALILGLLFAILSYAVKKIAYFLNPMIAFLRSLPVFSVLLLLYMFLPRTTLPVVIGVLSLFPIIYTSLYNALNETSEETLEMLKVYGVGLKKQIYPVYFKGVFPVFIKEIFTSLSFSLKIVVSAEILANVYTSVGGEMQSAYLYFNVILLLALTLLVCVLGVVLEIIGSLLYFKIRRKYLWKLKT